MSYLLLLTLHIASAIVLLGFGAGSAFYKFMSDRSADITLILHTNKLVVLADWLFTTPAVIVQTMTGVMLMNLMKIPPDTPWLLASIILFILSISLWIVAIFLQIRMKNIALSAHLEGQELGKEYVKAQWQWVLLGIISFAAMASLLILMIAKPQF